MRYKKIKLIAALLLSLGFVEVQAQLPDTTTRDETKDENDYATYEGFGNHVPDTRLHDIWAIVKLGEETIKPEDFIKGGPMLELNIAKEEIIGTDGCNHFNGSFELRGDHIIFSNLASTKMACPNMEISNRITQVISGKDLIYNIKNGKLTLKKDEETVMILKHID